MKTLVTGGAGFIGSALTRHLIGELGESVVNVDKLTYAGSLESLGDFRDDPRHFFERVDIVDAPEMSRVLREHEPDVIMHLAAESHVDRSIDAPDEFIRTNIEGTYTLLREARRYWMALPSARRESFRFLHVSTDEVYGSLGRDSAFSESSAYRPTSPYAASKASSDHLARAWFSTYGLPVVITNCSNNYGPYQFPEKLIPLMIQNAIAWKPLPVYGRGENVRDWIFVEDHVKGLRLAAERGRVGETYNIGGGNEKSNLEVVNAICDAVDAALPDGSGRRRRELITFVEDRPGHDFRYAIDSSKIRRELGWSPKESFQSGLARTIEWYLSHPEWCERIHAGTYRGERLGLEAM